MKLTASSWRMMRGTIFSSLSLYLKLLWQFCKSLAKTSGWQCIALAPQKQKWQGWPHKNADLDDLSWCVNNEGWLWTVPWLCCSMFTHSHASHVPSHCTSEPLRCHNLPTNHTFMYQVCWEMCNFSTVIYIWIFIMFLHSATRDQHCSKIANNV